MSTERMSFEEASHELGISEDELEQLVAAGEIATVKDGDTLYFKRDVVRKFKQKRQESVLLSDDEINLLDDSNVEEIDLLADDDGTTPLKPAAKAAEQLEVSPALDDDLPSLDLDTDDELAEVASSSSALAESVDADADGDETLLNMDGLLEEDAEGTTPVSADAEDATLLDTDVLDLSSGSDPFSADTAEETSGTDLAESGSLLRSGGARVMQMKKKKTPHAGWAVILGLAAITLVGPLGALTNLLFVSSPQSETGLPPKDSSGWLEDVSNFIAPTVESIADFVKPAK